MRGSVDVDPQNGLPTASFWECKEYQRTVKRVESANKLCSSLALLIHERAELERAYSVNLNRWSQRLLSFLDSGLEYGTGASLWRGLCKEAEAVSHAHESVRDILMKEIHGCLKHWQKDHFQKSPLPPQTLKQCKQLEQEFEQVQKPWAKRLKKVVHSKKDYHQACQTERSLQVQLQNAKTDPAGAPEQLKKIQEKLSKAEKEMDRTKSAYMGALAELDQDNPRYLEEMTRVFNGSQDLERERLTFFKTIFTDLHQALNVTTKTDFDAIYADLEQSIASCDIDSDLAWWSAHHGVDMPAVFPQFEEYSPELSTIVNKKRSQTAESVGGVTLTGITPVISSPITAKSEIEDATTDAAPANGFNTSLPTPFDDLPPATADDPSAISPTDTATPVAQGVEESSDVADYYSSATYDDGRPGVPVRALYDYKSQEDDELSFSAGDVFEKLEEADDQGWCKGRKDGRAGLYPANYVEVI